MNLLCCLENRRDGSNDSISKIKGASIILIINTPLPFFEISHHKNRPGDARTVPAKRRLLFTYHTVIIIITHIRI